MPDERSQHSVLDDLNGLHKEAEEAHSRYHDWKKVPYWDCPLSPCSWFNNDLPLIETQIRNLFEQLQSAGRDRDELLAALDPYCVPGTHTGEVARRIRDRVRYAR